MRGHSDEVIRKVIGGNVMRVARRVDAGVIRCRQDRKQDAYATFRLLSVRACAGRIRSSR
jgi:hypothetical protein